MARSLWARVFRVTPLDDKITAALADDPMAPGSEWSWVRLRECPHRWCRTATGNHYPPACPCSYSRAAFDALDKLSRSCDLATAILRITTAPGGQLGVHAVARTLPRLPRREDTP